MENLWWNQVTNAVRFINEVKNSLLDEKSVLLHFTSAMPWRMYFVESVREYVKQQNSEKKFVDVPDVSDPGAYLLNEFCKKEKRAKYRPSVGYASFLADNDDIVLHDRYLWVCVSDVEDLSRWMDFISEYIKLRGHDRRKAVFVLECSEEGRVQHKKGITVLSFDDYIGSYDRIVFAVIAASSLRVDDVLKEYTAELVSNVVGNDIELSAVCIKNYMFFLENPNQFLESVSNTECRSDGTSYIVGLDDISVKKQIWRSQIRTIYPQLEEYRESFVRHHVKEIEFQLPLEALYGETYNDPMDVELGTLLHLEQIKKITLKTEEYETLKRYWDARNKLSHLDVLSFDEIKQLL